MICVRNNIIFNSKPFFFLCKGMANHPLTFPNLVNSFDRNPQHAARAALYTRYTPSEWQHSNISAYTEADINR